jgi:hypothetical protein
MNAARARAGWWRVGLAAVLLACVGAAAFGARFGLVEPAGPSARCDAAPWGDAVCTLRSLVVQAFVDQRIGHLAWVAGALALALRSTALAGIGLAAGAAGLVLYSAGPAAPGLLLAALALLRTRPAPRRPP